MNCFRFYRKGDISDIHSIVLEGTDPEMLAPIADLALRPTFQDKEKYDLEWEELK